jgi:DMSO/TMAO reductase YedYZ heme-binding membrane subunit
MTLFWLQHIRAAVYVVAAGVGIAFYLYVTSTIPALNLQLAKLEQYYALLAIGFLYLTLLISPMYYAWSRLPGRALAIKARQAVGISAFSFGLLHASIAFFSQLGGFAGLSYLGNRYLLAIGLSATALLLLAILTATSIQPLHVLLGRYWKPLHRLVYLAGILIVIHALMLGSHFVDLSATIPQIFFGLLLMLLLLELLRFNDYLRHQLHWPAISPALVGGNLILGGLALYLFVPSGTTSIQSLGIHAEHQKLAAEAQQNAATATSLPGLTGDRTKRFNVTFDQPTAIDVKQATEMLFHITDASSGSPVQTFQTIYEKPAHLIIVDETLTDFHHVHPQVRGSTMSMSHQFDKAGRYRLYLDFQPLGAIEQQFGFTVQVGGVGPRQLSTQPIDQQPTAKIFGTTRVTLSTPGSLKATEVSYGRQLMSFELRDVLSQPRTDLAPYLGAYGHLVMINQQTYEYLHVHPNTLATSIPGGPTVDFMPLGIYGPVKPGVYRVFAQFSPSSQLFTADFTVRIQ